MPKQMKPKSLAKNSIFNMAYNVLNLLFPLITSMYVSRILMPDGIGKVAYAQNLTAYFITFASLGLPTYGIREIAKKRRDSSVEMNKLFTELIVINWITTGIASIAFLIFVFNRNASLDFPFMMCCGLQLFFNFVNIDWLYQGLEEYVYIVCRSTAIKIISLIAILLVVRTKADYIQYALITSVALAGNYVFNIIHAQNYVKFDFSRLELKKHFKPVFVLGLAIFFSTIYSKLDITMLGVLCTSEETGLYANAFKLVNIVAGLCASVSAVFLPRLSYYYGIDKEKFDELLNFGIKILSFFTFPMTTGLILLAPYAVAIVYGESFMKSTSIIQILAILILIKSFGDLLCYQLAIATGNEKKRLLAYGLAALMNIVLNSMWIPLWGSNGAAAASVCSELLLNGVQFLQMKKIVGYTVQKKNIAEGIIASAFMAVGICAVLAIKANSVLLKLILAVLVGSGIYIAFNLLMKNEIVFSVLKKIRGE